MERERARGAAGTAALRTIGPSTCCSTPRVSAA